jgi:RNA polymerase sigma-70 factor (ECF subfamily)
LVVLGGSDPAERLASRETVRLAFVAALQLLPAKQRAALILHEVLHWTAAEVADLLGTSVASINSALQRARATLAAQQPALRDTTHLQDEAQRQLLGRYVDAFERWDVDSLVALLHEDVTLQMPPFALWLEGPEQLRQWFLGTGGGCAGSRLIPVCANGSPAFAQYKPNGQGVRVPFAVHVLETLDGRIVGQHSFLDVKRLFPLFGLPTQEPA